MLKTEKSQLAKLLATEDLTVRHSKDAKTASFDVKNRILILPNWSTDNTDTLDMMIGHEVGHALYTLPEDWESAIEEGYHKGIVNVVEDARIEKRIKRRFPGLVRSFLSGYRGLMQQDFFGDLSNMENKKLIDRINLHFKLGHAYAIPFAEGIEQSFVDRIAECETWQDVLNISADLMEFSKQESMDMECDIMFPGEDGEDGDNPSESTPSEDMDFKESGLSEDYVETQEAFDAAVQDQLVQDSTYGPDIKYYSLPDPNLSRIIVSAKEIAEVMNSLCKDRNMSDEARNDLRSKYNRFRSRSTKIVNYMAKEFERKKSADAYRKEYENKTGVLNVNKLHSYKYNEDLFLRNTIRPDGKNHGLVMLLDWSGSMQPHLRSTIEQTLNLAWFCRKVNIPFEVYAFTNYYNRNSGAANVTTMTEDRYVATRLMTELPHIWRLNSENRAKNPVALKAVAQYREEYKSLKLETFWNLKPGMASFMNGPVDSFNLLNFLSSRMNSREFNEAASVLYTLSSATRLHGTCLGLGGTPLLDGLVTMNKILPAFKSKYRLDKLSLMVLTDGDGNSSFDYVIEDEDLFHGSTRLGGGMRSSIERLEDPKTKRIYSVEDIQKKESNIPTWKQPTSRIMSFVEKQEVMTLKMLADKYDARIIGIYIQAGDKKTIPNRTLERFIGYKFANQEAFAKVKEQVRKTGVASLSRLGYDEFHIVPAATMVEKASNLDGIEEGMTSTKIKRLFVQSQNNKVGNKVLVNRIMDVIA